MKFAIDAQLFAKALNAVRGAAGTGTGPRLVLLSAETDTEGGVLNVTASDTELQSSWSIACNVARDGKVCLDLADLLTVAKSLPKKGDALIECTKTTLDLVAGSARFRFPLLSADAFPVWDGGIAQAAEATLPADAFSALLSKVLHAVTDEGLDQLRGVFLTSHGGSTPLRAVATNGHRLALCAIPELSLDLPPDGVILPARTAREIVRLSQGLGMLGLTAGAATLRVDGGPELLLSKLIDGVYPNYRAIVDDLKLAHAVKIPRAAFLTAVERVGAILTRTPILRLTFDEKGFHLRADRDQTSALETVAADGITKEGYGAIGLNARYIADALKTLASDVVEFAYGLPEQPVVITGINDPGIKHVIMPMRL